MTTAPTETSVSCNETEASACQVSESGVGTGITVSMSGVEDGALVNVNSDEAETEFLMDVSGVEAGISSESVGTGGIEAETVALMGVSGVEAGILSESLVSTSGVEAETESMSEVSVSGVETRNRTGCDSANVSRAETCSVHSQPSTVTKGVQTAPKTNSKCVQADFQGFGAFFMEGNDHMTKFYTGLPSWDVFELVYSILIPHVPKKWSVNSKLQPRDELLLVLMRLRLNSLIEDLAYRFGIAKSTVTTICNLWIDVMSFRLKFLIKWADKEIVQATMPKIFKETYPLTRCIIDCSEIFIERPVAYQARAKTYSNYKKHNTAKFLIAISPSGSISFISTVWGGRVSDKVITQKSGFLDLLDPGDTVLADRGFTISEDLRLHGAKLEIPSFTRGKSQLTQREVEFSQRLARVRIHVERVIGLMKNKYTILQGILPIPVITHKHDTEIFF